MSKIKKKPDYNTELIMQKFMKMVDYAFDEYDDRDVSYNDGSNPSLNAVATEFGITALKAQKLLINSCRLSQKIV